MTAAQIVLLLGAGAVAGVVGSAGGTASLIAYPVLLAVGIPPLPANVTISVAFVAAWPGSALGSQPELRGQGPWLRRWAWLAVAGSAAGAALLLVTPAKTFDRVVPYLLAFAALALLVQPQVSTWLARHRASSSGFFLSGGLIAVSAYDGYWGAGAGVLTLAMLMITTGQELARSNALKNMLLGVADVTCCVVFVLCWPVDWAAAVPMAAGVLAGSMVGPFLTRHMPARTVRITAALAGLGLAIYLWAGS
ncbi:MAG: sulfite exporter TauE/SafE family protein [Streptosporangiaceae bacterium]